MALLLVLSACVSVLPALIWARKYRPLTPQLVAAIWMVATSSVLLVTFVLLLISGTLDLSYSIWFGSIGIVAAVAAAIIAIRDLAMIHVSRAILISVVLNVGLWMFLLMLH